MEYKNKGLLYVCICVAFIISYGYVKDLNERQAPLPEATSCKEDSLHNVIDSLQSEIFYLEDGFDDKEHRYESVLSEYEIGLSYLKDYHPTAYRDFHRIIGMKEQYSHQLERENKKRLKSHE